MCLLFYGFNRLCQQYFYFPHYISQSDSLELNKKRLVKESIHQVSPNLQLTLVQDKSWETTGAKSEFSRATRAPPPCNKSSWLWVPLITRVFNIANERQSAGALSATVLFNCPPPQWHYEAQSLAISSPSGVAPPISRPNPSKWHTVAFIYFRPETIMGRNYINIFVLQWQWRKIHSHCSRPFVPNTFLVYFATQLRLVYLPHPKSRGGQVIW